jgi:DNA-binding transcriptional regulator YiaG
MEKFKEENPYIKEENMYREIKEVRVRSSFSTKEFSEIIGVSQSMISRVELRKDEPSEKLMNKLKALAIVGRCSYIEHGFDALNSTFVDSMTAGVSALYTFDKLEIPEIAKGFLGISLAKAVNSICEINDTIVS